MIPRTSPSPASTTAVTASFVNGAIFLLCCAAPVVWVLVALVGAPGAWNVLEPIRFHLRLLLRTIAYNAAVAMLATAMAIPVAVVMGRGRGWFAKVLAFILPAALLMPSIVYAYGWMQVLRLANLWSGGAISYPVPAGGADVARCIWTLATWLWPIPAAILGVSLRRMDYDLQLQALLDGALWRVTARRLLGPALAGMAIVAILAMQEFAVYEPTGISVVATEVRTVFETGQPGSLTNPIDLVTGGQVASLPAYDQQRNAAAATIVALPLLIVIGSLAAMVRLLRRREHFEQPAEAGPWPAVLNAGPRMKRAALVVIALTLMMPLLAMLVSLKREPDVARIWRTFWPPIAGTLSIGAGAAAVALVVGACGVLRRISWPVYLGLATFLVGGQLLAIALIRIYNHPSVQWVYNGPVIVVMAYLARFGWLAAWAARWTHGPDFRELRNLAAVDGAGPLCIARHVVLPLAWPMLLAAAALILLLAMTEVPATVLLQPLRPPMLVPQLMTWVHTLRSDDMIEGSLLLAAIVMALALLIVLLVRRGLRWRRTMGRAAAVILLMALPGCGGGDQPDEIWLETGAGEGQVVYPRAIAYSKIDDTFFVVDRLARIQHLDRKGRFINGWRMDEFSQGKPVGLSVGPDGNLWVPDTHYSRIIVFSPDGKELRRFGKPGLGRGEFTYPSDIAFDGQGRVFISEFGDHDRIQVFDQAGNYLNEFGKFGQGSGELARPQSIVIDGDKLYVTDACNHRISVWSTDGLFIRNMGTIGSALGQFRYPYGLDIDGKGRLVVCEFGNNRVQLIDKETGKGLAAWGLPGREPGQLAYPWAVAVDRKGRVICVDAGNNRLQVFGF